MPSGSKAHIFADDGANQRERALRLRATARDLIEMAEQLDGVAPATGGKRDGPVSDHRYLTDLIARSLYRDRRLRGDIFPCPRLFGEPAWDILLDLYIAQREGKTVSVTSACIGAAAPTTTALRYLNRLENLELVRRLGDPGDGRRALLRLSEKAIGLVERYLSESNIGRLLRDARQ